MKNYDRVYSRRGLYWRNDPNSLCREVVEILSQEDPRRKKVIDLGSGEGRDLMHFSRNGFSATGVEISLPGINKSLEWAKGEEVEIDLVQSDLNDFKLESEYGVIYSSGSLTFIRPENRGDAFADYKSHTSPGGLNAFNVFVVKPFMGTVPDWGDNEYFYREGELASYYFDWKIIKSESETFSCNSGGLRHTHAMETLMARKM
ncbi:hypothetical protein IX51_03145 [uncultured archaeon]|nr:hypothetical protein IX51_03145 [uncultured archaeon]